METYQQIYQQYQATIAKKYLVIVGPIRNRSNAEDAAYNILLYEKQYPIDTIPIMYTNHKINISSK